MVFARRAIQSSQALRKRKRPWAGGWACWPTSTAGRPHQRKVRVTGERSGPAFEIKYMDVSSTTVVFVEDGRIEFRDAQGLLQSVQADDVRQINRI